MKTKSCSNCKEIKLLACFGKHKSHKDGLTYICLDCVKIRNKKYTENYPWVVCFNNIKARCNNKNNENFQWYGGRGIQCLITVKEVKFLYERDNASKMKKPSINRKDNNENYTVENCYFDEQRNNSIEANRRTKIKPILQFDKQGNFIKEWKSISEASSYYNTSIQNISSNLRNKSKSACGFVFKLKKK